MRPNFTLAFSGCLDLVLPARPPLIHPLPRFTLQRSAAPPLSLSALAYHFNCNFALPTRLSFPRSLYLALSIRLSLSFYSLLPHPS